jgi:hypothetical protein
MGGGRTVLSPVMAAGGIWRVRITWPNGAVRCFGKFASKKDAIKWIAAHPQLTEPPAENTISEPPAADPPPPKFSHRPKFRPGRRAKAQPV